MTKLTHIEIEIRRFALLGVEAEIGRLKTLAGELRDGYEVPEPMPWEETATKLPIKIDVSGLGGKSRRSKTVMEVGQKMTWLMGNHPEVPLIPTKPKRKMSAAGRAAISKAQKARWKKAK